MLSRIMGETLMLFQRGPAPPPRTPFGYATELQNTSAAVLECSFIDF